MSASSPENTELITEATQKVRELLEGFNPEARTHILKILLKENVSDPQAVNVDTEAIKKPGQETKQKIGNIQKEPSTRESLLQDLSKILGISPEKLEKDDLVFPPKEAQTDNDLFKILKTVSPMKFYKYLKIRYNFGEKGKILSVEKLGYRQKGKIVKASIMIGTDGKTNQDWKDFVKNIIRAHMDLFNALPFFEYSLSEFCRLLRYPEDFYKTNQSFVFIKNFYFIYQIMRLIVEKEGNEEKILRLLIDKNRDIVCIIKQELSEIPDNTLAHLKDEFKIFIEKLEFFLQERDFSIDYGINYQSQGKMKKFSFPRYHNVFNQIYSLSKNPDFSTSRRIERVIFPQIFTPDSQRGCLGIFVVE